MASIPKTQQAAVKKGKGEEASAPVTEVAVPEVGEGQILVKIHWSGVCATDKSLIYDEWEALGPQCMMRDSAQGIAGHEGAGSVVAVHPSVEHLWKIGERAGIKWVAKICRICEFCTNGRDEVHCKEQLNAGLTCPGTFQQYALSDAHYATHLPDGVSDEDAGPIMCGGVTAYVACKRTQCKTGQWMVILGAGGGLGHLGVQYAKAMGIRVIAVDGGEEKDKLCKDLGAEEYIDFTKVKNMEEEVLRITTYGAHGVIVFSSATASYEIAPMLLRPGGYVVSVGIPVDPKASAGGHPAVIALRQINIAGSVTGTNKEVQEALDLTSRGLVKPILIKGKLSDLDDLMHQMKAGKIAGRVVVKVA